jgi:hypothetical protein
MIAAGIKGTIAYAATWKITQPAPTPAITSAHHAHCCTQIRVSASHNVVGDVRAMLKPVSAGILLNMLGLTLAIAEW